MIEITVTGDTKRTEKFLASMANGDPFKGLESLAQEGVAALKSVTPHATGETAAAWTYEIEQGEGSFTIWWLNTHTVEGFNVAIGLQYGHGTGQGGWVQGYDYINPALRPVFDKIADKVWKEVQNA